MRAGLLPIILADPLPWAKRAPYAWDFLRDRARFAGGYKGALANTPGWSFTRASTGYAQTSAGALMSFASGELRRTDKGVLIEGARTNVITYSQEFDNVSKSKANVTVVANQYVAPDGTTTADQILASAGSAAHYVQTNITWTNAVHTISFYARYDNHRWIAVTTWDGTTSRNASFDLLNGVVGAVTNATSIMTALSGGWYRCTVTGSTAMAAVAGNVSIGPNSTDSASSATWNPAGTEAFGIWGLQAEAASFPSSYIPTTTASATRAADVLTVALPTYNTNLCLQSQTLDSWTSTTSSVTANSAAAPDGTTTADYFIPDSGTTGRRYLPTATTASATTYTASIYFNVATTPLDQFTVFFGNTGEGGPDRSGVTVTVSGVTMANYSAGAGAAPSAKSIETLSGGWYRLIFTFASTTVSAASAIVVRYLGASADSTKGVLAWGAQLETGSTAGAYIPTTTVAVTSAPLNYPLSLLCEFERAVDTGGSECLIQLEDNPDNTDIAILFVSASDALEADMVSNNVLQAAQAMAGSISVGVTTKGAARFAQDDVKSARGGTLSAGDVSATVAATPVTIRFGARTTGGSPQLPTFGYLRRAALFSRALSDSELTTVTSG